MQSRILPRLHDFKAEFEDKQLNVELLSFFSGSSVDTKITRKRIMVERIKRSSTIKLYFGMQSGERHARLYNTKEVEDKLNLQNLSFLLFNSIIKSIEKRLVRINKYQKIFII